LGHVLHYVMKNEILELDSELSCATILLGRNPPEIHAAQVHIDDARALLVKLNETSRASESAYKSLSFVQQWKGFLVG